MSTKTTFLTTCKAKFQKIKNPLWKQRLVAKYKNLPVSVRARFVIYLFAWVFLLLTALFLTLALNVSSVFVPVNIFSALGCFVTSVMCFINALLE